MGGVISVSKLPSFQLCQFEHLVAWNQFCYENYYFTSLHAVFSLYAKSSVTFLLNFNGAHIIYTMQDDSQNFDLDGDTKFCFSSVTHG